MRIAIDARVTQDYTGGVTPGTRVPEDYKGGFTTYILNLLRVLKKIDRKNKYFYCTHKKNKLLKGIKWWRTWVPLDNHIIGDPWEQFFLPIELAQKSIDIYHATTGKLPLLKFNTKYVLTVYDLNIIRVPEFVGSRKFVLYAKLHFFNAVKRADKIIAISQSTKKDLMQLLGVEEKKIKVILLGIDEKYCVLDISTCSKFLRNKYGIIKNYILVVGVFNPRKNLQRLFMAHQKLRNKGINNILVVVGFRGWRSQEILESVEDGILFVENVSAEQMPYFYNCADLFVYPSLYEGFGLPVLEAMACGTPVAASRATSIPEVVGDAGLLFDPLNVDEITNTMWKILTDAELRQDLRNKGLERVKLFSWEKTARETLALYEDVIEGE
ncbi:MAG: glycosyltransferase family 4 protein [Candidatus Stahlbacteria bacterium]|nr:glycosyltransferase family 4 protein [Candidatus Stahlbacteria bacterium]